MNKALNGTEIFDIETDNIPGGTRSSGKWYMHWLKAKSIKVGASFGVNVENEEDVERLRTAMLSYSRRARESWRLATHHTQERPKTIYFTKVKK